MALHLLVQSDVQGTVTRVVFDLRASSKTSSQGPFTLVVLGSLKAKSKGMNLASVRKALVSICGSAERREGERKEGRKERRKEGRKGGREGRREEGRKKGRRETTKRGPSPRGQLMGA